VRREPPDPPAGPGLAIECATTHVEVAAFGADDAVLAHVVEEVGHGHTRRLAPLIGETLQRAGLPPSTLEWVAADLGPGSFTGVRVGLASATALAQATGATALGASSLAALAHAAGLRRALVVPLVTAGRRDVYAGFYRADARGGVTVLAAPTVGDVAHVHERVVECLPLVTGGRVGGAPVAVRFVGPGARREVESLEARWPGAARDAFRGEGPSALDLARAARSMRGEPAGLPEPGEPLAPRYVRPPQAEESLRWKALAHETVRLRDFRADDIPAVAAIEREVFRDAWPEAFFRGEIAHPLSWARVAELDGRVAGYLVALMAPGAGSLENVAVAPAFRRRGLARRLVGELLERARSQRVEAVTLEVRVSNDEAQSLYRALGFRLAGLRRGYYRDNGEDALVMEWRADRRVATPAATAVPERSHPRST
jgi:tRNA threonylcarbamoyl adenosine modification protein YeaZ/ribosomal-protein-alanine acetyltransferase